MRFKATVLLAGCCLVCAPAFATLVQAPTPAALLSNDSTNWAQEGGDATALASGFTATSALSNVVTGTFSGGKGLVAVVCPHNPSCSWSTSGVGMSAGDSDIWAFNNSSGLGTGPLTLAFGTDVMGAGAYLEGDTNGVYTATIQAFNGGTSLGTFSVTSDATGDPVFLGALDSAQVITSVQFALTSCAGCSNNGDFAIDTLLMTETGMVTPPTPEPSSLLLLGSGLAGMAWMLRKRALKSGRRS